MRLNTALCSLALLPLAALAGEIDSYCALAAAQGQVQAATLTSPEAFASVGDPSTEKRNLVVGMRKSYARERQGRLAIELAEAQCTAYRSQQRLGLRLASVELVTEQRGLQALSVALKTALSAAQAHLEEEQQQLARHQTTLMDLRSAFDTRDRLQEKIARTEQRLSYLASHAAVEDARLLPDVERAIADQARVTELSALLQAETAWDVSIALGVRRGLSDGTQSAFASVAISRSFGEGAARSAARTTRDLAARWLGEQQEGPLQKLVRVRDAVAGAHSAGELIHASLQRRMAALGDTLGTVRASNTAVGLRLARALQVEIRVTEADMADSAARQAYLQSWLALNGAQP